MLNAFSIAKKNIVFTINSFFLYQKIKYLQIYTVAQTLINKQRRVPIENRAPIVSWLSLRWESDQPIHGALVKDLGVCLGLNTFDCLFQVKLHSSSIMFQKVKRHIIRYRRVYNLKFFKLVFSWVAITGSLLGNVSHISRFNYFVQVWLIIPLEFLTK